MSECRKCGWQKDLLQKMKRNILVFCAIFSFSFLFSSRAFAQRGPSYTSVHVAVPLAWDLENTVFMQGLGAGINKVILPDEKNYIAVDYGATLSFPISRVDNVKADFYFNDFFPAVNVQAMIGILFAPFNFEKAFLGIGGAFGISVSYAMPAGGKFFDSIFSLDIGAGGEVRGGILLRDNVALVYGCTVLFDFFNLDLGARKYTPEKMLVVLPSIGFALKKRNR